MQDFNPLDLSEQTYLVTGASSGLGKETAILLSKLGAGVVLSARSRINLHKTLDLMENKERHFVAPFDFSKGMDAMTAWLEETVDSFHKLNGLVHCVGVYSPAPLKVLSDPMITESFNVNVFSAVRLAAVFRNKKICTESKKSIVFMSSVAAIAGSSGLALYSMTKGSLVSLVKSLAIELVQENIRVNCISPALINTRMTNEFLSKLSAEQLTNIEKQHPMGLGEPSDAANAVAFLLADTAKWITGANLIVDGGYTAQ